MNYIFVHNIMVFYGIIAVWYIKYENFFNISIDENDFSLCYIIFIIYFQETKIVLINFILSLDLYFLSSQLDRFFFFHWSCIKKRDRTYYLVSDAKQFSNYFINGLLHLNRQEHCHGTIDIHRFTYDLHYSQISSSTPE